jgi:hypothetical protein
LKTTCTMLFGRYGFGLCCAFLLFGPAALFSVARRCDALRGERLGYTMKPRGPRLAVAASGTKNRLQRDMRLAFARRMRLGRLDCTTLPAATRVATLRCAAVCNPMIQCQCCASSVSSQVESGNYMPMLYQVDLKKLMASLQCSACITWVLIKRQRYNPSTPGQVGQSREYAMGRRGWYAKHVTFEVRQRSAG